MRKHIVRAIICVILSIVTCVVTCTSAFAATSKEKYISEIIMCNASSADDAEKQLKDKGYKLLSTEEVSSGMYLGYKSTTNPDEAITDISAMNMTGNYSFTDYETLLDSMRENVSGTIDGLIPMITKYRENYKAGQAIAVQVYEVLNKFYEDDSKKTMGDYLLSCNLEDTADLTEVFMEGYSPFIVDIQQLLYLAGENDNDRNWIQEMAAADPDDVVDLYVSSYATPNKAYIALASDFGSAADDLQLTWDGFYEDLQAVVDKYYKDDSADKLDTDTIGEDVKAAEKAENAEIADDATQDEIVADMTATAEAQETNINMVIVNLIEYLKTLEYDGGTMLDFFLRPYEDVDVTELYTLAYYMGEDLTAQISNVGLEQIMQRLLVDGGTASENKFETIDKVLKAYDQVSIYSHVDRSLFENGVAITGETISKYQASGKSWSDGLFDRLFNPSNEYKWDDYFAFYVLPTVASFFVYSTLFYVNRFMALYINSNFVQAATNAAAKTAVKGTIELIHNAPEAAKPSIIGYLAYGQGITARNSVAYRIVAGVRCAFFILTIVLIVVSIVMLFVTIAADDDKADLVYSAIPNHIVDTVSTDNGDDYVAYNVVNNLTGSAGDLYNYKGKKGWMTLYYTKEAYAGDPITTDVKIVKGSTNSPLGYENVSLFGEENAVNISSKDYTGAKDSANGTYLYFTQSSSAAAGSVFSNGNMAIAIAIGAIAGLLLGLFLPRPKKKKEPVLVNEA